MRSVRKRSKGSATLRDVMQSSTLVGRPDEPLDAALDRMANASQSVLPVVDPESGQFLGSVTRSDVIDLVVLMEEIEAELKQLRSEEI